MPAANGGSRRRGSSRSADRFASGRSSGSRARGRRRATGRIRPCPRCTRPSPPRRGPSRSARRTARHCPTPRRSAPGRPGPTVRPFRRRSPCSARIPECGRVAACSNDRPSGIGANARSGADAYSANAPCENGYRSANTRSPGLNLVTSGPTASTTPATSTPTALNRGARSPVAALATLGRPYRKSRSARLTDAATTRTTTPSPPGTGRSTSRTSTTSGPP